MAIATCTLAQVIDNLRAIIEKLTPSILETTFVRSPTEPVRGFVTGQASDLRLFDVLRAGPREDPGFMDPAAALLRRKLVVTVAYPARLGRLYGRDDQHDLEALADADAQQLHDAILSPGNVVAVPGLQAMVPVTDELDRSDPGVWFLPITVEVLMFAGQTLT